MFNNGNFYEFTLKGKYYLMSFHRAKPNIGKNNIECIPMIQVKFHKVNDSIKFDRNLITENDLELVYTTEKEEDINVTNKYLKKVFEYCYDNNIDTKDGYFVALKFTYDENYEYDYKDLSHTLDEPKLGADIILKKELDNSFFGDDIIDIESVVYKVKYVNKLGHLSIKVNDEILVNLYDSSLRIEKDGCKSNDYINFSTSNTLKGLEPIFNNPCLIIEDYHEAIDVANNMLSNYSKICDNVIKKYTKIKELSEKYKVFIKAGNAGVLAVGKPNENNIGKIIN